MYADSVHYGFVTLRINYSHLILEHVKSQRDIDSKPLYLEAFLEDQTNLHLLA